MLTQIFPRAHGRYSSLPLLGAMLEDFTKWLIERGYPLDPVRQHLRTARRLDDMLWQHGNRVPSDITREALRACAPAPGHSQDNRSLAATARIFERYLEEKGRLIAPEQPLPHSQRLLAEYRTFLEDVRGFSAVTIAHHAGTVSQLLVDLGYERHPAHLANLVASDIEDFVRIRGKRISRASLQHEVAHLRSFLRFLATRGEIPPGLDTQIDTPRVYRLEQLPHALPWKTVCAFLRSIDRSSPQGSRDYAIFLLVATYGLRASEIVTLKLEDIEWRAGQIRIHQRKTASPLLLPLTDTVGEALIDYLRRDRPELPHREIFLRCRAPGGVLKATAVTEAFQTWSKRSGLSIPFHGPHCLRHSYAVHLLRQGTSLKTIGDILGHRTAESTCVYLRLAVEELREVALPLPAHGTKEKPS